MAQSAMFHNIAAGTFTISGTEVWAYDKGEAANYFSNTLTSGPEVSCAGKPADCLATNRPAPPPAPLPDPQKLIPNVSSNSCNFWNGTELKLNPLPKDNEYKQSVTISGNNGSGNWKFEWTYTIGFAAGPGPFPPRTAWKLVSSSTTAAEVGVDRAVGNPAIRPVSRRPFARACST